MNINRELVARAMNKAGEEPINEKEWEEGDGTRVRLIKDIYQATVLEALSTTAWTTQKRRAQLELSIEPNLTSFFYVYNLPIDCAKPIGLNSQKDYIVENGLLYTNDHEPILIYITNYFTGKYKYKSAEPQPQNQEELSENEYYVLEEEVYTKTDTYDETKTYYIRIEEDYNFYDDPELDPVLSAYIETMLAAKAVLKLTGDTNKYQILFNEAAYMENRAIKSSTAQNRNKKQGSKYWSDILGLPNYGDERTYDDN